MMKQPLGVILAGGQANRMGGGDKALITLGGVPLLSRVNDRLAPQVDGVTLNANGDPARFASFELPVVPDTLPGALGPLAGVLAGLAYAEAEGHTHIVTAAADSPFFPCDLVPQLLLAANAGGMCLAASPSGLQGTFGLWPVTVQDTLRTALDGGQRKVTDFTDAQAAGTALFPDDRAFFNINTPEDLAAAEAML